ncbi:hypothetical protein [Acinetobacter guillouiae]|uniref:hypothetical protein n=1 Tax=Acinetobacter guillouiae TaxID=106649 RepID=UPI001AE768A3|nr:hypothetical protein [Acinetobacter guillouiae]MBP2544653.1 hypothetical protein [Acinetobacter guillouiae]
MENISFLEFLNNRYQKADLISHGIKIKQVEGESYYLHYHGYDFALNLTHPEPQEDPEFYFSEPDWETESFDTCYSFTDKSKSGYLENYDCYYNDKSTIEFSLTATKLQKAFASNIWNGNIFHFSDSINDISISRMSHEMAFAFFESDRYAEYFNKHLDIYLNNLIFCFDETLEESGDMAKAKSCLVLNLDILLRSREFTISMHFKEEEKKGTINYSDPKTFSECVNKVEQVLYLAAKKDDVSFFLNNKIYFLPELVRNDDFSEISSDILLKEIDEKVISYYKAATYTEVMSQKFLYYYQVLEYFFLKVTEEQMLIEIEQNIFNSTIDVKEKAAIILDKIIAFKNRNDELESLKKVVNKYTNEAEIIGLVDKYKLDIHVNNNSNFFKKNPTDALSLAIDKNGNRALPNLAGIIYFIRCLLVHSSDKYDRLECWVPFSDNEKIIQPFVPVMKTLAEIVIENSATPKTSWF